MKEPTTDLGGLSIEDNPTPNNESWRERFDNQFGYDDTRRSRRNFNNFYRLTDDNLKELKSFIQAEIDKARESGYELRDKESTNEMPRIIKDAEQKGYESGEASRK